LGLVNVVGRRLTRAARFRSRSNRRWPHCRPSL